LCEAKSVEVVTAVATTAPPSSFQPSAAAVAAILTEVGSTGVTLSKRMAATSRHLTSAATGYTSQDADSAATLGDLAVTV